MRRSARRASRRSGWRSDGDADKLDGFQLYLNGERILNLDSGERSISVIPFEPPCGERYEFYITAHDNLFRESPPSNRETWNGEPCPRTVRITFEELQVHNPPADELGRHNPGTIFGQFRVFSGVREETLGYDASHCWGAWIFEQCVGLKLERRNYSIMDDLFDWVYRGRDRCRGGPGSRRLISTFQIPI